MKTSAIGPAGLALAAILTFSSTGCRVTHYNVTTPRVEAEEDAVCKSTCDRLLERHALSSGSAKACLSACRSGAPAVAAAPDDEARAPDDEARAPGRDARAHGKGRPPAADSAAGDDGAPAAGAQETEAPRASPAAQPAEEPCPCAQSPRPARAHASSGGTTDDGARAGRAARREAPARAPACQTDWDCPEDMACDAGTCH